MTKLLIEIDNEHIVLILALIHKLDGKIIAQKENNTEQALNHLKAIADNGNLSKHILDPVEWQRSVKIRPSS